MMGNHNNDTSKPVELNTQSIEEMEKEIKKLRLEVECLKSTVTTLPRMSQVTSREARLTGETIVDESFINFIIEKITNGKDEN